MDLAYNQHSPHSRHRSHSSTNLNHLTLAPLTTRLPIADSDDILPDNHHISYIEGRSAPTTPSILSRSTSRVSLKRPAHITLPKSKSSTHIHANKQPRHAPTTPGGTKLRHAVARDELSFSTLSVKDRNDSDWLLRAGASISSSTRESKGQAWLVSRASSTSLTAQRDDEDEEEQAERILAREREQASRRDSRRGSVAGAFDADDECSPVTTRRSLSFGPPTGSRSRPLSRFESRSNSRRGSKAHLFTPMGGEKDGYFDYKDFAQDEFVTEPDFVDVEEENMENAEDVKNDEAEVRKLARATSDGLGGWVERMLGWTLFAVDEDAEDGDDAEGTSDERTGSDGSSKATKQYHVRPSDPSSDMPPLNENETTGWSDAAWLLSVATKVLL